MWRRLLYPITIDLYCFKKQQRSGGHVWKLLSRLKDHALTRTILTGLILVSGFNAGAIINLDIGFIAFIDKADLIVLILFYGSLVALSLRAAAATFEYLSTSGDVFEHVAERAASLSEKNPVMRHLKPLRIARWFRRLIRFVLAIGVATLGLLGILAAVWAWQYPTGKAVAITGFLTLLSGYVVVRGGRMPDRSTVISLQTMVPTYVAILSLSLIGLSVSLGMLYIDVLRTIGPRVTIHFADASAAQRGSFAFPAREGFIVFFEGDGRPHYLPLSQIAGVDGYEPLFTAR